MRLVLSVMLGVVLLSGQAFAEEKALLKTQKEKQSYGMGADIGKRLKSQSIDVDADSFVLGLKDVLSGGKMLMTEEEIRTALSSLQKELMEKQAEKNKTTRREEQKRGSGLSR